MTSEDGEMWKAVKLLKQKKRASNRENSSALLEQSGIHFTSHNAGAHLVVEGRECFIDFWPGTGKWISRNGTKGFGVRKLLEQEMTNEQHRKMLECAAKACGVELDEETREPFTRDDDGWYWWNPLTNPADTAEMCAKLGIGCHWNLLSGFVICGTSDNEAIELYKDHDNSRLKAWMFAATMVAAKIGGYEE